MPALIAILFGGWRIVEGSSVQANPTTSTFVLTMGSVWALMVVAMLALARGRAWLVQRRIELCLSAGVGLVCLVIVDLALNYFGFVPTIADQRAKSISYAFGRFTNGRLVTKEIRIDGHKSIYINQRGFRGPDILTAPLDGRKRIVFLGGSQVFDYAGGGWPEMVGQELRLRNHDVEVINAGVPGHNSTDSLGKLLTDIWTLQPDIIFLCNAWNDIKYFQWLDAATPYRGLAPVKPRLLRPDWRIYPSGLEQYLTSSAIYRQFRWGIGQFLYNDEGMTWTSLAKATGKQSITWGLRQYEINIRTMAHISRHIGAKLAVCKQARLATASGTGKVQDRARDYQSQMLNMGHSHVVQAFAQCHNVIDKIAADQELLVVDMDKALSGVEKNFVDGIHFSEVGSRAAAALVARAIEPMLAEFGLQ